MERFDAYKLSRGGGMYPSIFNSFPVIRTASAKIAILTYRRPHFCFPWRRPCDYHAICCMDGKTIQCLPNPSQHMCLSIFNSFRVIRCLSQCVDLSPKIAIFTTFFPWGRPWGNHAKCCIDGKRTRCLQIVSHSRCMCQSIYYHF